MNDELCHYGVKGMKWGVRRYQNKDGSLTKLGKTRRDIDAVNDIMSTMSKDDKKKLNLHDGYKETIDNSKNVLKRVIKRMGNVPVSFFEVTGDSDGVAVSIGTRSGDKYRNKGYALKAAKEGKKWIDEHYDEFDKVVWWARKDNIGSIKTAERIGFKLDKSSVLPDDPWIMYQYKK